MNMRLVMKMVATAAMALLMWGCADEGNMPNTSTTGNDDSDATTAPELDFKKSAVLLTPDGNQTCTGPTDPTCSAKGPDQQLSCNMELECELWTTDANCTYPEGAGFGAPMVCEFVSCNNDNDCDIKSPDSNLDAKCIYTDKSIYGDELGVCLFTWPSCSAGNGPCEVDGYMVCATENDDTDCTCSESEDLSKATDETCNGLDDDCDGMVDEDLTTPTTCGVGACASIGEIQCDGGVLMEDTCEAGDPGTETCNGLDDDCDGMVDEDLTTPTTCGVGACASVGQITCVAGAPVPDTCVAGEPSSEICDGEDNDCDSMTDEETDVLLECGLGVCAASVWNLCDDGVMQTNVCVPGPSSDEICDGLDNDCDGVVDNGNPGGGVNCSTGLLGVCAAGTTACTEGGPVCNQNTASMDEICDGLDNDCDGATDEGCDDDGDGYCDALMVSGSGASCEPGDCNDENASVHPGMMELCSTPYDDDCDGDTVNLKGTSTPACSSCANALKLPCGVPISINMATQSNTSNAIQNYSCWTNLGSKTLSTVFAASETMIVPDAPNNTPFSLQITTPGTGTLAFRLHGSCEPNEGTSSVTAYHSPGFNGTCAAYSSTSVANGVVGQDFIALDAPANSVVTVLLTCDVAP